VPFAPRLFPHPGVGPGLPDGGRRKKPAGAFAPTPKLISYPLPVPAKILTYSGIPSPRSLSPFPDQSAVLASRRREGGMRDFGGKG
jgi:hypothetical protein